MAQLIHTGSRDFDQIMVTSDTGQEIILVHQDEVLHAYVNSCPHVGIGLDYGDGRCLMEPGLLVCAMHGAAFEADTGLCVDGPCVGQSLRRLPIQVTEAGVALVEEANGA